MFDPARVWAYRAATVPRLAHAVEPVEQSRPAPIPPAWVHGGHRWEKSSHLLLPACAWVHLAFGSALSADPASARVRVGAPANWALSAQFITL